MIASTMVGSVLGHYRIVEKLGSGGMGEVYRAEDIRLLRNVAIKVLPAEVAGDPTRMQRLEREARAVAALNHPNIAAIYGLEETDGSRALVLELVPGQTLMPAPRPRGLAARRRTLDLPSDRCRSRGCA